MGLEVRGEVHAHEGEREHSIATRHEGRFYEGWAGSRRHQGQRQAEADAKKDAAKDDVVDAEFTEVDDDKNNKKSA